ncbi:MAG: type II toxin-antitoxin system RelE/ParE family toxin [Defluviitaleaceae bacterium]|nr:type II toxin-antitoxin system RelE/ParE family toxin [Defluviitaleaceae bacterium]
MARIFITTQTFDKEWNKLGLNDETLRHLQNYILLNPGIGDIIVGTGGLIKLRWNLPNTGKSGGIRTLYVDFVQQETTIFINCYSKGEKDTLTHAEKTMYKKFIAEIKKELGL